MRAKYLFVLGISFLLLIVGCEQQSQDYDDIVEFQEQVEEKKKEVLNAEKEYTQLLKEWNKRVPDSERVDISQEMKKRPSERIETWLKRRVQKEKPISYEGLADEIDSLNNKIGKLQNRINDLEQKTGFTEPYVVQSGDTHFGMAMEFLMNKHNMSQEEAKKYIKPLGLYNKLREGFFVYFYFDEKNDRLHTSINQGNAPITPSRFKQHYEQKQKEKLRRLTKLYKEEQENYENAIEKVQEMRKDLNEKSHKIANLDSMYSSILSELGEQSQKVDSLDRMSNSIFYTIKNQDTLVKQGLYDIGFLGLNKSLKRAAFDSLKFDNSIDLRRKRRLKMPEELSEKKLTLYNEYGDKITQYLEKSEGNYFVNLTTPIKNSRILVVYR